MAYGLSGEEHSPHFPSIPPSLRPPCPPPLPSLPLFHVFLFLSAAGLNSSWDSAEHAPAEHPPPALREAIRQPG